MKLLIYVFLLLVITTGCTKQHQYSGRAPQDDSTLYNAAYPFLMPYNRAIAGAGNTLRFGDPYLENHALDVVILAAGNTIAVEDRYGLVIVNEQTQKIISRWSFRDSPDYKRCMSTFSGLKSIQYHDSTFIFWGAGERESPRSYVVQVYFDGKETKLMRMIPFHPVAPSLIALPNEVQPSVEQDELMLYTVLNGNNQIVKLRVRDQKIIWTAPTGNAPFGLVLVNGKIYVTNWAGPLPLIHEETETAGIPWGNAYSDPKTGGMRKGSVSVLNENGTPLTEIKVGLHPNAIVASPDNQFVYVSNGNSDYISVIRTDSNQVVDSVFVGLFTNEGTGYLGSSPNALALSGDASRLFVSNGMDNAIAVVKLGRKSSVAGKGDAEVSGFIPTEAYPAGLIVKNGQIIVANLEGNGARSMNVVDDKDLIAKKQKAFNAHKQLASVSFIAVPSEDQLNAMTVKVKKMNYHFRLKIAEKLPRKNIAPKPLPERIGEPSVFKHVLYIIKENRTYDQVLGDMNEGRGKPELCIYGDSITPNQHQLARDFQLLDNYYVSGKSSAEGHHWASAAMVTDYTEKSVRAWFRSYPHVLYDAMVYDKKGLIWNHALDYGKSVRIYGEACTCEYDKQRYSWTSLYKMRQEGRDDFAYKNMTTISRVRPILARDFPGCDDETIPDQLRADAFIRELRAAEETSGGNWPQLMIMSLPNDHTSGTEPGFPTPNAMVADNDLALGRIIEAIMSSRFADSTVIFISEDDSQGGWDHISAYRTTAFVVSRYSRIQQTIHTNYNQTSIVRTMEQILGLPPMNILDATALPMFDCFAEKPDLSHRFKMLPNRIPLDQMNPESKKLQGSALRYSLLSKQYAFHLIDRGHDNLLNRILWLYGKGDQPYPETNLGSDDDD